MKTSAVDPFWQGDCRHEARNRLSAIVGRENHLAAGAAHQVNSRRPSVCNSSHQKNPRHTLFLLGDKKEKCQTAFRHAVTSKHYNRCFTRKLERFIALDAGLETLRSPCQ